MLTRIMPYLNFTQLFVIVAFFYFLIFHSFKKKKDKIVLTILSLSFLVELIALSIEVCKYNKGITLLYSFNAIIHNSLWLFLFYLVTGKSYINKILIPIVVVFGFFNFIFFNDFFFTFILGAIFYLVVFIRESFYQLEKENFSFFESNDYLLLFSPTIFFLGYSLICAFSSYAVYTSIVFGFIKLYDFVGFFINLIYYSLIVVYIKKQKKLSNG